MIAMKIFYFANAHIPTAKAHGAAIVKMCAAFANAGAEVVLVVPRRRRSQSAGDPYEYYGVPHSFRIVRLPVIDLFFLERLLGRFAFWIELITLYVSATGYFLFQSREGAVYARDYFSPILRLLGFRVVYECHHFPAYKKLFFALQRLTYKTVTISGALKEEYLRRGWKEREIWVAPSGVDLSVFQNPTPKLEAREELGLPCDGYLMVYTGNFTTMGKDKGISDCILALKALPNEVHLVAAGGSEADVAHYANKAQQEGVAARVHLAGHMPQRELARYNSAADVLMMPFPDTPHYRSHMSPVKMFEYMASGRPIIASDLPTIREVLSEEDSFIVQPNDPQGIARAVEVLRSDPVLESKLAEAAGRDVARFSWDVRARNLLTFISS